MTGTTRLRPAATRGVRIGGVHVRISAGWWIAAALLGWMLARRLFPRMSPDASDVALTGMAVAGVVVLFVSVLLHELAHAAAGRRYGVETVGVTLHLLGGVTEMRSGPRDADADFAIAAAGPVASFALALAFAGPLLAAPVVGAAPGAGGSAGAAMAVLIFGAALNGLLAILNLLPVFPLDGGRMLRAVLWRRLGDLAAATRATIRVAQLLGILAIVGGAVAATVGERAWGTSVLLVGLYLRLLARTRPPQNLAGVRSGPPSES